MAKTGAERTNNPLCPFKSNDYKKTLMNNKIKIRNLIKKWQPILNLGDWVLNIRFVNFNRKDYQQSGDIEVDPKNKKATILFSNNPQKNDEYIIVHELIHLLFWEYDHLYENLIPKNEKGHYFDLLEETVVKFTKVLLQNNK